MAKKSEAADKSIENNADYVLTFGEAIEMLRGKEVELEPAEETKQEGSVFGKRFGNGGGVTNAVIECFKEKGEMLRLRAAAVRLRLRKPFFFSKSADFRKISSRV